MPESSNKMHERLVKPGQELADHEHETVETPAGFEAPSPVTQIGNQGVQRLAQTNTSKLISSVQGLGNQAIQRMAKGAGITDDNIGEKIKNSAGQGTALDAGIQRELESGLGANLSGVRVHTDSQADSLTRQVNASAFTSGSDIYFRSGGYDTSTPQGRHVLAHEVTHTVQQSQGPVAGTSAPGGVSISDPSDSFEQAAEASAAKLSNPVSSAASAATQSYVQRAGPEEELQGYVQRAGAEEEEPMQGYIQRVGGEEEPPVQGYIQREAEQDETETQEYVQRVGGEEEPPVQGYIQRAGAEEEEPMQGYIQRAGGEEEPAPPPAEAPQETSDEQEEDQAQEDMTADAVQRAAIQRAGGEDELNGYS